MKRLLFVAFTLSAGTALWLWAKRPLWTTPQAGYLFDFTTGKVTPLDR